MTDDAGDAASWTHDWNDASGTSTPTPRAGWAHLFLLGDGTNGVVPGANVAFLNKICAHRKLVAKFTSDASAPMTHEIDYSQATNCTFGAQPSIDPADARDGSFVIARRSDETGGSIGVVGTIHGEHRHDPYHMTYISLLATNAEGYAALQTMRSNIGDGGWAWVEHAHSRTSLTESLSLRIISGVAPSSDTPEHQKSHDEQHSRIDELSARFSIVEWEDDANVLARCHVAFRDSSLDPCLGPTIEFLEVRSDRRGEGLLRLLYTHVMSWIEARWRLEVLSDEAPLGALGVKTTGMCDKEVEVLVKKGKRAALSERQFFTRYAGFSARFPSSYASLRRCSGGGAADDDCALYVPLQDLHRRGEGGGIAGGAGSERAKGRKVCEHCRKMEQPRAARKVEVKKKKKKKKKKGKSGDGGSGSQDAFMMCGRCKITSYCSVKCQQEDWERHKVWCCKPKPRADAASIAPPGIVKSTTASSSSSSSSSSSAREEFAPGDRVIVRGLKSRADLNGRLATVQGMMSGNERVSVLIDEEAGTKALKPANLERVAASAAAAMPPAPPSQKSKKKKKKERSKRQTTLPTAPAIIDTATHSPSGVSLDTSPEAKTQRLTHFGAVCERKLNGSVGTRQMARDFLRQGIVAKFAAVEERLVEMADEFAAGRSPFGGPNPSEPFHASCGIMPSVFPNRVHLAIRKLLNFDFDRMTNVETVMCNNVFQSSDPSLQLVPGLKMGYDCVTILMACTERARKKGMGEYPWL